MRAPHPGNRFIYRAGLLLVGAGLARPEVQSVLHDASGQFVARADLYYRAARLVIEYDGGTHRDSLVEDNRGQNKLTNIGHRLLRYTAADVYHQPERVVAEVGHALKARLPASGG